MSITTKCPICKGEGSLNVLISMHDNKKKLEICPECKGVGQIHYMSDEEEQDYHDNYW